MFYFTCDRSLTVSPTVVTVTPTAVDVSVGCDIVTCHQQLQVLLTTVTSVADSCDSVTDNSVAHNCNNVTDIYTQHGLRTSQ